MIKDIQSLTTKQIDEVFASLKLSDEDKLNVIQKHLGDQVEIEVPSLVFIFNEDEKTTEYFKIDEGEDFEDLCSFDLPLDKAITESEFHHLFKSGLKVTIFKYSIVSISLLEKNVSVSIDLWWEGSLYDHLESIAEIPRSDAQGFYELFEFTATEADKEMLKKMAPKDAANYLLTRP